jgi:sulfatase modifying factor 1
MWEWNLDWYVDPYPDTIYNDCANIHTTSSNRVFRGGGWFNIASGLLSSFRVNYDPTVRFVDVGARCARTP